MNWSNIFVIISSILIVSAAIPYFVDILKGKTKPRVVTWSIWGLLNVISGTASLIDHQYSTAILLAILTICNFVIVFFGWKHGDKKIGKLDTVCFIGAIIGILLWWLFNSPAVAVIATIIIDFIGAIPTFKHAWQKPFEETLSNYLLGLFGEVFTLFSISTLLITAFAFPIYAISGNLLFSLIIIFRRKSK